VLHVPPESRTRKSFTDAPTLSVPPQGNAFFRVLRHSRGIFALTPPLLPLQAWYGIFFFFLTVCWYVTPRSPVIFSFTRWQSHPSSQPLLSPFLQHPRSISEMRCPGPPRTTLSRLRGPESDSPPSRTKLPQNSVCRTSFIAREMDRSSIIQTLDTDPLLHPQYDH